LRWSARNLLHYLSLRQADHGTVQAEFAQSGLSRPGVSELHVQASIDAVLGVLERVTRHSGASATTARLAPRERAQSLAVPRRPLR